MVLSTTLEAMPTRPIRNPPISLMLYGGKSNEGSSSGSGASCSPRLYHPRPADMGRDASPDATRSIPETSR
jgi:hypothetical protein